MNTNDTPHDVLDGLCVDSIWETTLQQHKSEAIEATVEEKIDTRDVENASILSKAEIKTDIPVVVEKTKLHSIVSKIMFVIKYVCTSSLIFIVLLVTTNYSAYFGLLKSYIYADEMAHKSELLIHSVAASNIQKEVREDKQLEAQAQEENSKNPHSIEQILSVKKQDDLKLDIEIVPYENRIVIPKIAKNIPLLDIKNQKVDNIDQLNDIFMEELENGVIRYPGSAKPGQDGKSFVFGHSSNFPWMKWDYNDVFALLDNVEFNDEIIVYYGQKKHTYKVNKKQVITPGDVSVLKGTDDLSEITLMTCWPIGTTLNRLVVTGTLVE